VTEIVDFTSKTVVHTMRRRQRGDNKCKIYVRAIFTKFIQLAMPAEILEGIIHLHKANGKLVFVFSMDIYVYNL
jgi:hypothetical protein